MSIYLPIALFNALFIFLTRKYFSIFLLLISIAFVLYMLPTTGMDYDYYKSDYLSAYYTNSFPFFKTDTILTAEPFYKIYTSFISVVTGFSFEGFLALNFILCYGVLFVFLKRYFRIYPSLLFLSFGLVSIVPTIFYFSPRSSISFTLAIISFFYFVENKNLKGLVFSFLTIGFHSQFIPALIILFFSSTVYKYLNNGKKLHLYLFFMFFILFILLKMPFVVYSLLSGILSFLPTGDFISSKLNYFKNSNDFHIRITSILSIIIYPLLFIFVIKKNTFTKVFKSELEEYKKERFVFLLGILVYIGFVINILMFGDSHIAGRLSRMSDYFLMMILLPIFFYLFTYKNFLIALIIFSIFLVAPILYPTVYNFNLVINI